MGEGIPVMKVEEASAEKAVSVRKRMEDEMKKDVTEKPESVKDSPIVMASQDDEDKNSVDLPKIKSDLKHKEDSNKAEEDERERRRNEDEKYERRKREERQRDRDRKDRERNEKMREEEERRRRRKMDEE